MREATGEFRVALYQQIKNALRTSEMVAFTKKREWGKENK
jgi:hypothetical protein